jgi:hypothetical protein
LIFVFFFERRETMSTQPNTPAPELFPDWHDPFREPLTIPAGWDLSEMSLAPGSAVEKEADSGTGDTGEPLP